MQTRGAGGPERAAADSASAATGGTGAPGPARGGRPAAAGTPFASALAAARAAAAEQLGSCPAAAAAPPPRAPQPQPPRAPARGRPPGGCGPADSAGSGLDSEIDSLIDELLLSEPGLSFAPSCDTLLGSAGPSGLARLAAGGGGGGGRVPGAPLLSLRSVQLSAPVSALESPFASEASQQLAMRHEAAAAGAAAGAPGGGGPGGTVGLLPLGADLAAERAAA
jgi:hypothetical protein